MSENRLASEIENKYIHHLASPASVAPQANTVSLVTSSLTSSLQHQSLLPATQCDTSPLASSSVNQYYQSDQLEITAPQPPSSVPQQERAGSSTHTSPHHSKHVLPSSQNLLRTGPHTSPSHAAHSPRTHQFFSHPSRQPHMPIPHPAHRSFMRPPQFLPHFQPYPASSLTAQPQGVKPYPPDRPSQVE